MIKTGVKILQVIKYTDAEMKGLLLNKNRIRRQ